MIFHSLNGVLITKLMMKLFKLSNSWPNKALHRLASLIVLNA